MTSIPQMRKPRSREDRSLIHVLHWVLMMLGVKIISDRCHCLQYCHLKAQHAKQFPSNFRSVHLETFSIHSAFSSSLSSEKMKPLNYPRWSVNLNCTQFLVQSPSPLGGKLVDQVHLHVVSSQPCSGTDRLVHATVTFLWPGTAAHVGQPNHPPHGRTKSRLNPRLSQPTNRNPTSALLSSPLPRASWAGSWDFLGTEKGWGEQGHKGGKRKKQEHTWTISSDIFGEFGETVACERQGGRKRMRILKCCGVSYESAPLTVFKGQQ